MSEYAPPKDPDNIEPYFFVWCDVTGTNVSGDNGELQAATISTYTVTVPTGITKASDNKSSVIIAGITYAANTVVTVWLSGGTVDTEYEILCRVVTSDSRTLDKTMTIPIRSN